MPEGGKMYVVDPEKAIAGFKAAEDMDADSYSLSKEIDRVDFDKFYRIMTAKTPDDISDISTEDILGMFAKIGIYAPYFEEKSDPIALVAQRLGETKTVRLGHRRIL